MSAGNDTRRLAEALAGIDEEIERMRGTAPEGVAITAEDRARGRPVLTSPYFRLVLARVARALEPVSYLEVGVKQGHSLAEVIAGSQRLERVVLADFWTINEKRSTFYEEVRRRVAGLGFSGSVRYLDGSSAVTLPCLQDTFELVGVDGSHRRTALAADLRNVFRLLAPGGCVVVDDLILFEDHRLEEVFVDFAARNENVCEIVYRNGRHWPGVGVLRKVARGRSPAASRSLLEEREDFSAWLEQAVKERISADELAFRVGGLAHSEALVTEALTAAYVVQDWDVVEHLALVAKEAPSKRYTEVLCRILDRQCLEISNGYVVAALSGASDPGSVAALGRALRRESVGHGEWVPAAAGERHAVNTLCLDALLRIGTAEALAEIAEGAGCGIEAVSEECALALGTVPET